jgi:hypothetical protein
MDKNLEPNPVNQKIMDLMTLQTAIRVALLQCGCPEEVALEFAVTAVDTMAQSVAMKDDYREVWEAI